MRTKQYVILITVFALAMSLRLVVSTAAAENDRFARIVLFVKSDAEAPENYEARLASLAVRTEGFLGQWMTHWERTVERKEIFSRNDDGTVSVTLVKGELLNPKGKSALSEVTRKAIEGAAKQRKLRPGGAPTIWWIFYDYPEVQGFRGGARGTGGMAINAYPKGNDLIDPKAELAEGKLVEMAIKGTIHEFGHALGLPHIGPRPDVKLGNSLMGPINRVFWQRTGSDDTHVYLSEASAAALWKHPIFRKENSPDPKMPSKVSVAELEFSESEDGKTITVKGTMTASDAAHSVVVYDSERGQFGDYWARTYVAPIDPETGAFEVTVTGPFRSGTLFLSFAFDSGINTGDGQKRFQQGSSVSISYSGKGGGTKVSGTGGIIDPIGKPPA